MGGQLGTGAVGPAAGCAKHAPNASVISAATDQYLNRKIEFFMAQVNGVKIVLKQSLLRRRAQLNAQHAVALLPAQLAQHVHAEQRLFGAAVVQAFECHHTKLLR